MCVCVCLFPIYFCVYLHLCELRVAGGALCLNMWLLRRFLANWACCILKESAHTLKTIDGGKGASQQPDRQTDRHTHGVQSKQLRSLIASTFLNKNSPRWISNLTQSEGITPYNCQCSQWKAVVGDGSRRNDPAGIVAVAFPFSCLPHCLLWPWLPASSRS